MSDILRDFDKKNETPKYKTDLADEIIQTLGIIGVYVSVGLTNEEMHLNKLDFSEHNKVFEDEIRVLKGQVEHYKSAFFRDFWRLNKLNCENNKLKQRIVELENFSCQAEQETESLFEQLKRRIAELESKNNQLTESILRKETKIHELESKESEKTMRIEFHADNGEMLTPLEVANSLINQNTFKVDELRELAEHLQVYCQHHNGGDTEAISF